MTSLQPEDFDALDDILDDLRTRYEETPQWEFCEGFLVALICCRRAIPEAEWLPVLLGFEDDEGGAGFSDEAQKAKFLSLWQQRFDEVKQSIDTEIKALDEDSAYAPEVMDVRGAIASLPPEERAEIASEEIPAFAQVWALGFMFVVENLWAVYDLREIWRNIGPRVVQVVKEATPGRNDVCNCGSGKKYKKCCGAS